MRRALAAFALILAPHLALAQAEQARLTWDAPAEAGVEAVITVRNLDGIPIIVLRNDVEAGAQSKQIALPPMPRAAESIQGGLMQDGRVIAQSPLNPVAGTLANGPELRLREQLALGLHDYWSCGEDGQPARVTWHSDASVLRIGGEEWALQDSTEDGATLQPDGNAVIITLPDQPPVTCDAALFRPLLPMDALAADSAWRVQIGLDVLIRDLPELEATPIPLSDLAIQANRDGQIIFDGGDLRLTLSAQPCTLDTGTMPYPLTARLEQRGSAASAGCAGSPLHLIDGASWYVTRIFGQQLAGIDGAAPPDMTLQIAGDEVSGRGTCNRYLGRVRSDGGQLAFTDIGTTRLACPLHKQNLELRFLDVLETATGFDLSADGMLILRAGHMPVLTAKRR